MEKELALLKAENRQLLSNIEDDQLVKSRMDYSQHSDRNVATNQIATLEAKLLEYSHTISKLM